MLQILAETKEITSLGKFIDVLIFIYVAVATPLMIYYASKLNKKPLKDKKRREAETTENIE
ncbi:MAG: hypothetical protein IJ746_05970 [Ruminococcus sp.]|nr:hypothetical protein [Ruminococcus sp.]